MRHRLHAQGHAPDRPRELAGYCNRAADDNSARAKDKSFTSLNRYGRTQGVASRHGLQTGGTDDKYALWDISRSGTSADGSDDYRNELNTFGFLVEIDPYSKTAVIKKRTGLGCFAHESAAFSQRVVGKALAANIGDDSRGEYFFFFFNWVSTATWIAADANPSDRIATGDKRLDAASSMWPSSMPTAATTGSSCPSTTPPSWPRANGLSLTRPMWWSTPAWRPMAPARPRWTGPSGAPAIRSPVRSTSR